MYRAWKDILPQLWEPWAANADVSHDGLQSDFSLQCAERRARFNCICTDLLHIEDTELFSIIDSSWLIGCISCRWPWHLAGTDWRVMWYCLALSLFWVNSCFTQQMSFVPDKDCSSDCWEVSQCAPSSLGSGSQPFLGQTPPRPQAVLRLLWAPEGACFASAFFSFSPGVWLDYFWNRLLSSVKVSQWK